MTATAKRIVESKVFQNFILYLILFNAALLGAETFPAIEPYNNTLYKVDFAILLIFTLELILKLIAYRKEFFKNGWNYFDTIVVGLSLLPSLLDFSILRMLRLLRILRVFSMVPKFRLVIKGFFDALAGMISVVGILLMLLYMAAVMATKLFSLQFPQYFGSLQKSFFSMFQIMTLEGWPDIVRNIMQTYPYAWVFFVPFILLTTFTIFNLLIGVIVNSMQKIQEEESEKNEENAAAICKSQLEQIYQEIHSIKQLLNNKN